MRNGGQSQNKFLRIISTPFRALSKARDLYVRSITGCASRTQYPSSSSSSVSTAFPRSRSSSSAAFSSSASTRRATDFGIDDDYSELVRAASVRSLGHKNEIDMFIQEKVKQEKLQQEMQKKMKYGGLPKSTSVRMAKIDEEEEGEEGSVNPKKTTKKKVSELLYPRSKSYAVTGEKNVEAPWSSGQGLKASTPRSGVQTPDNAISTGRGLSFNSRRRRIMQKN